MTISIGAILPVGTIIHSMLTVAQFEAQYGDNWVISDGRSVTDSLYALVTGFSTIPDLRGGFLRAKGATLNPDGDLALGTLTADKFESHTHVVQHSTAADGSGGPQYITATTKGIVNNFNGVSATVGGNETAPVSVTVNVFIRIN